MPREGTMNKMTLYLTGCAATSVLAMLVPQPALAQDPAPTAAQDSAPMLADNDAGSAEIIITAQKRSERLIDVPVSVQVLSSDRLDQAVIRDITDVGTITPGVVITKTIANVSPYIRGIGTASPLTGVETAVAMYVDGVYQPASIGTIFAFNNIASIEVLKGPQGTLYGRNATGGVINVITRDPSHDAGIEAKASYANYDTYTGNLYVTGGITDGVAADVAVYYTKQNDGFGRNLTLKTPFLTEEQFSMRGKILIEPEPDTQIRLSADYTEVDSDKGVGVVPLRDGSDGTYANVGFYDTIAGFPYAARIKSYGAGGQLDHDFGAVAFKLISAYRSIDSYQQFSQLADAARPSAVEARTDNSQRSFSTEIQLTSQGSGPFSWIAGAFYLNDEAIYNSPNGFSVDALTPFGQVRVANIGSVQKLDSISGYFDASYKLPTGTTISGGIRYTSDTRNFVGYKNPTQAVQVIGGVPTIVTVPAAMVRVANHNDSKVTYRAVIEQQLAPDAMIYASYSTGFRGGFFAGNGPTNPVLRPENVTAIELGSKVKIDGLRVSAAGFHYDYSDLQVTRVVGVSPIIENAAKARIKGIEIEGDLRPMPGLTFSFGGQYLDARYTNYTNVPSFVPVPGTTANAAGPIINASGRHLRIAPEWTGNVGFAYTGQLSEAIQLRTSANLSYNDGYFFYPDERIRQDSFILLSGRIGLFFDGGRYGFSLFGKNLTNARYFASCRCGETAGDQGAYGEPRRYGIEAEFKF